MWKRLRHPNIVSFIGVTTDPLQIVSEWMSNGTLTEFIEENPGTNRIGLVGPFLQSQLADNDIFQAIGCSRRSRPPSREPHRTRKPKRGRYFYWVHSGPTGNLWLVHHPRRTRLPRSFDRFRASFDCSRNELHRTGQRTYDSMGCARNFEGSLYDHTGSGHL